MHKTNLIESTQRLLLDGGIFKKLFITDIEDSYLLRMIETEYYNAYIDKRYNVLNKRSPISNNKSDDYKHIKVKIFDYDNAVNILNDNNIITYNR